MLIPLSIKESKFHCKDVILVTGYPPSDYIWYHLKKKKNTFFENSAGFVTALKRRYRDFPRSPAPTKTSLLSTSSTRVVLCYNQQTYTPLLSKVQSLHWGSLLVLVYPMALDKCIHHYTHIQSSFTSLKILCAPPLCYIASF